MKKLTTFLVRLLVFTIIARTSYNYLTITRYAPGDEPASFFPVVLEVPESKPPRFELLRWLEFKKLLATNPKRTLSLPVGERRFTLEQEKNFTPSVKFKVIADSGGQRIEVTHSTDDYIIWGEYRVVGNAIIPVRVRSVNGMPMLFAIVIGVNGTLLLNWLYTRIRKRTSAATAPLQTD
ncbi:MAG: hypothetical protein WCP20_14130 [Desulfuromonadales bacterium]